MESQYNNSEFEEFLLENMQKEKVDEGLIKSSPLNQAIYIFKRIVGDSNISFLKDRGVFFYL